MTDFLFSLFAVPCAFLMGFAINQGSTCAVTAAKELVHDRRGTMLTGFAVTIGTAGLICLPLAWIGSGPTALAHDPGISTALFVGAGLLGVGAVLNDACLLGTLARIGHGEVRFLALPLGLAAGFALADRQSLIHAGMAAPNVFARPSLAAAVSIAGFAALLVVSWVWLGRSTPRTNPREWPLRRAMILLGLCGALLFALAPGWTYADAVRRGVAPGGDMTMIGLGALCAAGAALAGALVSGIRARAFVFQRPTVPNLARSLFGGAIMAFGSTLIPGGNDTLLLASVPSVAPGGITAYFVMSATVALLLEINRRMMKV